MGSIFGGDEPIIVHSVGGDVPAGEVETTVLGAAPEGFEAADLVKAIDINVEGEYADEGEFKLVGTLAQLAKLVELINRHVDLDVVEFDNDDPSGAQFARNLLDEARGALHIAGARA